ncbi:MAG TPA: glycosyl hydrolase family 18 protein [Candidatus Xenobia bacterium]|nr:glycosyl hydrolase family 18 protein [Candidatus Xenobia bacterium]
MLGVGVCLLAAWAAPGLRAQEREFLTHFYYVNDPSSWRSLQKNSNQIDLLSPNWFAVDAEGAVHSELDPVVVKWAHECEIALMPLVVNKDFDPAISRALLHDKRKQKKVIERLLALAAEQRFAGYELDFEQVAVKDRKRLSAFVERFSKELKRRGRKLGIAVHAPLTRGKSASWVLAGGARAFDYRKLARHTDYIALMSYDLHIQLRDPGPIASLPWMEACVQRLLEEVPRHKLLLGLPFYFRRWNGHAVSEGSYLQARALAEQWQARVETDPVHREKNFVYQNGEGRNQVWFNDAEDLGERLALVRKHNLRGFSAWRLGQEDPAFWSDVLAPRQRAATASAR